MALWARALASSKWAPHSVAHGPVVVEAVPSAFVQS
jgi:hypothetical protein